MSPSLTWNSVVNWAGSIVLLLLLLVPQPAPPLLMHDSLSRHSLESSSQHRPTVSPTQSDCPHPSPTSYPCGLMATNKRILSSLGNGPTRRNLFGPVDRELLQVEYQAALQKDLEEAAQRWGYDFISDKPLENSNFQWEGIPGTKVPLVYRSCMLGVGQSLAEAKISPKGGRVEPPQSEKENIPGTPERCVLNLKILEKTPEKRENAAVKRKQTNITDFYQAKRRVVGMPRKSGE
ncbi:hypothetical protein INR49_029556 [Caranx melampygus]|nr:hypothetical protein INR49_029556 [Caranx melampygus]